MTGELTVREMNPTNEDLDLFREMFTRDGSTKSLTHLRWQYLLNPGRKLFVDFATDPQTSRIAAVYAVFPVHFRINGQVRLASQSLDTRTDRDYRGRGLFVKLAKLVYARCEQDGIAFVYGFPNGNSIHGFLRHLGWHSLDPIPMLVKPLNIAYFARRLAVRPPAPGTGGKSANLAMSDFDARAGEAIAELRAFDQASDDLWREFSNGIPVAVERSREYMKWRFPDKPGEHYVVKGYYEKEILNGLVIYTMKEKHGGRIGYVMELLVRPGRAVAGRKLLDHACRHLRHEHCDAVLCLCLEHSPNYSLYRRAG